MNGTTFDAFAVAKALREAGFEDRQAEAVRAGRRELATKADLDAGLAVLRSGMRADLYRALWILGAGLVAIMISLVAALAAVLDISG